MRVLLDTHALLWWLFDDPRLSVAARDILSDPANEILVSAASAWEISTKYRLGKLPGAGELLEDFSGWLDKAGFRELAITVDHAEHAGGWPHPHRDPFDRMLAAQSVLEALPLVTSDRHLRSFEIETLW